MEQTSSIVCFWAEGVTRLLERLTYAESEHGAPVVDIKDEIIKQLQKENEELKKANVGGKGKAEVWIFVIFL